MQWYPVWDLLQNNRDGREGGRGEVGGGDETRLAVGW